MPFLKFFKGRHDRENSIEETRLSLKHFKSELKVHQSAHHFYRLSSLRGLGPGSAALCAGGIRILLQVNSNYALWNDVPTGVLEFYTDRLMSEYQKERRADQENIMRK